MFVLTSCTAVIDEHARLARLETDASLLAALGTAAVHHGVSGLWSRSVGLLFTSVVVLEGHIVNSPLHLAGTTPSQES
jgi:hypothetical protein